MLRAQLGQLALPRCLGLERYRLRATRECRLQLAHPRRERL